MTRALLTKEMNDGRLAMLAVAYFALAEIFVSQVSLTTLHETSSSEEGFGLISSCSRI